MEHDESKIRNGISQVVRNALDDLGIEITTRDTDVVARAVYSNFEEYFDLAWQYSDLTK